MSALDKPSPKIVLKLYTKQAYEWMSGFFLTPACQPSFMGRLDTRLQRPGLVSPLDLGLWALGSSPPSAPCTLHFTLYTSPSRPENKKRSCKSRTLCFLVGMARFELAASWSRTMRATKLRYIPEVAYYKHQTIKVKEFRCL